MSFSDDFGFDELDSATLQELDAIEASVTAKPRVAPSAPTVMTSNLSSVERAARLARIERSLSSSISSPHVGAVSASSSALPRPSATTSKFKPVRQPTASPAFLLGSDPKSANDNDPPTQPNSPTPPNNHYSAKVPLPPPSRAGPSVPKPAPRPIIILDDSFVIEEDDDFVFDELALQEIDQVTSAALAGKPRVPTNMLTRQTTLTGEILPQAPPKNRSFTRTKSNNDGASTSKFAAPKVKTWSHQSAIARTKPGRRDDPKGKGKGKAREDDEEVEEEELPPPPVPGSSLCLLWIFLVTDIVLF